ncbi:MAG: hypothetical protein CVV46_13555 [Spirochaetae bacterium HGW-Spirochaetae-2]|jgi:tripartite ATP-independent transporter DctP family solute receptor|nr:MAG: hypothetical protein CVV46_13555 [Spirochaetae bacterium HGW-Spirochaetae-2]
MPGKGIKIKSEERKMRKSVIVLLMVCVLSGSLFAAGQTDTATARPMVINAAHSMPTTYHYHDGMMKFAEEVASRSNGTIEIEIYPAAQLGEEVSTMEQCKMGAIPIVLTGVFDSYVSRAGVFNLPFLFRDGEHANAVLNGPIGQEVFSDFSKHGMKVISVWENGFRQITNNRRPINSVNDMVGLKIRTPQSPVWMKAVESFGATPTPMPFADVATAIVQGLVDGQENAILHILANKTYEVQKYLAVVNYMYGSAPLLVNEAWFKGLTETQRTIIVESAAVANTYMRDVAKKADQDAIKFFESQGLKVTYPELDGFRAKVEPLYKSEWSKQYGADLIDSIRNMK